MRSPCSRTGAPQCHGGRHESQHFDRDDERARYGIAPDECNAVAFGQRIQPVREICEPVLVGVRHRK